MRDLTNNSGVVQDHLDYDGFGNITSESSPSFSDRHKWAGREFDADLGLQYNRARYYDPEVGRWTSEDPIGFAAGDGNLYRYVHNSPTNKLDPSGLSSAEAKFIMAQLSAKQELQGPEGKDFREMEQNAILAICRSLFGEQAIRALRLLPAKIAWDTLTTIFSANPLAAAGRKLIFGQSIRELEKAIREGKVEAYQATYKDEMGNTGQLILLYNPHDGAFEAIFTGDVTCKRGDGTTYTVKFMVRGTGKLVKKKVKNFIGLEKEEWELEGVKVIWENPK